MALSGPNARDTLAGIQEQIALEIRLTAWADISAGEQKLFNAYIEDTLDDMAALKGWAWIQPDPFTFNTIAPYKTGTVSVTKGSKTVTGTSTLWTANVTADLSHFKVGDGAYRVDVVTNNTSIDLIQKFAEATASAQTYSIMQAEYELGSGVDFVKSIEEQKSPNPLTIITYDQLIEMFNANLWTQGAPRYAAMLGEDRSAAAGLQYLRCLLYPVPDDVYHMVVRYRSYATYPTTTFNLQPNLKGALMNGIMAKVWRYLGELDRSNECLAEYQRGLAVKAASQRANTRFRLGNQWTPVSSFPRGIEPWVPDRIDGT